MWISEIFRSIDGEVNRWGQGTQSTFVRFSGCSERCEYCDTKYAWDREQGKTMTVGEVVARVKSLGCSKATITGGEPLEQREAVFELVDLLHSMGFSISLETNGLHSIKGLPHFVCVVMDVKLDRDCWEVRKNIRGLNAGDFVKIVIRNFEDYGRAKGLVNVEEGMVQARFAFSPVFNNNQFFNAAQILQCLQEDGLSDVVLNIQIHKLLEVK